MLGHWILRYRQLAVLIFSFALPFGLSAAETSGIAKNALSEEIRQRLQAEYNHNGRSEIRARVLVDFYQRRGFRSIWYSPGGRDKAEALLQALQHINREGLHPGEYRWADLRKECLEATEPDRAGCELKLSGTLMTYARDVGYGRYSQSELDPEWYIDGDALHYQALLERMAHALQPMAVLQSLSPPLLAYRQLRHALEEYRWLEQLGGWPIVPGGPLLRPGVWDERIPILRERLVQFAPALSDRHDSRHYDATLKEAVEQFQARHGLDVDGIVGPGTLQALNTPVSKRIAQIRSNMERWRWMPRSLPSRYIAVNLPAFQLSLFDQGDEVLQMRAIAGRTDRPSPAFRSRVTRLIVNPNWTVPETIVFKDILPRLSRDPGYLSRKQIIVLRHNGEGLVEVDPLQVDWRRYDREHFPFLLRQSPGPHNSLGRLKFEMPNPYDIYLHDTPEGGLFNKNVRSLSSGCIRLEEPRALAGRILDFDDPDAAITYVDSLIDSGDTSDKIVSPELVVFLLYFTVWVDDNGLVHFRDDVYNRNAKLNSLFSF